MRGRLPYLPPAGKHDFTIPIIYVKCDKFFTQPRDFPHQLPTVPAELASAMEGPEQLSLSKRKARNLRSTLPQVRNRFADATSPCASV